MQYMLLIYEDERIYGPDKNGPALQELVAKHMAFNKELGAVRVGGAGLKATASATTVRTSKGAKMLSFSAGSGVGWIRIHGGGFCHFSTEPVAGPYGSVPS